MIQRVLQSLAAFGVALMFLPGHASGSVVSAEHITDSTSAMGTFNNGNFRVGQTFLAQHGGLVESVTLDVLTDPTSAPSEINGVIVEIRDVDGSGRPNDVLSSAIIPAERFQTNHLYAANFLGTGLALDAGTDYAITVLATGLSPSITWIGKSDEYDDGLWWSSQDAGGTWVKPSSGSALLRRDVHFRVTVTSAAIPEPSTLLIWSLGLLGLAAYARRRRTK